MQKENMKKKMPREMCIKKYLTDPEDTHAVQSGTDGMKIT